MKNKSSRQHTYPGLKSTLIIFLLFGPQVFGQTRPDDITGTWLTGDGERKVLIYKQNKKYFGKITWVKARDKQNEVGAVVMQDLEFAEGEYDNGSFIMPGDAHNASCAAVFDKNGVLRLIIYHGLKIFGHSIYLYKAT